MKIHILFWTVLVAIILAMVSMTGCATMPRDGESWLDSYYRQKMGARGYMSGRLYRRPIPVAPTRVGFNRPPVHWNGNPFRFQINNETKQYHVRCIIDGQEHQRTVKGAVLRAYVRTPGGLQPMALIPPGESTYLISDGERHNMRCELYGGPMQVLPNGAYVFKKVRETWYRNWTPERFPDRICRISDTEIMSWDRL